MAITTQMRTDVSQLYVALFGRAPDGEGLGYWVSQLDAGKSIVDIANAMYGTAPARTYYPSYLTNQEIVGNFYTNVLGRTADAEGLAYWTDKLNAAGATPGSVIAEIIGVVANYTGTDPAGLKSAALFKNKVQVAQWYGEQNGNIAGATSILSGVTEDPATVEAAKTGGVQSGQTFMLTTGQDAIVGTSGNDTILGVVDGSANTLTLGDSINGGAGVDTLKITTDQAAINLAIATITNVENFVADIRDDDFDTLNLASNAFAKATLDFNGMVHADDVDVDVLNVNRATAVEVKNVDLNGDDLTISYAGSAAINNSLSLTNVDNGYVYVEFNHTGDKAAGSYTVNLDNVTDVDLDFDDAGAALELNVVVNGDSSGLEIMNYGSTPFAGAAAVVNVTLNADLQVDWWDLSDASDSTTTFNITGSGNLTIDSLDDGSSKLTVNGATATGNIDITFGTDDVVSVTTGSGDDRIVLDNDYFVADSELVVAMGAGMDTLAITGVGSDVDIAALDFSDVTLSGIEVLELTDAITLGADAEIDLENVGEVSGLVFGGKVDLATFELALANTSASLDLTFEDELDDGDLNLGNTAETVVINAEAAVGATGVVTVAGEALVSLTLNLEDDADIDVGLTEEALETVVINASGNASTITSTISGDAAEEFSLTSLTLTDASEDGDVEFDITLVETVNLTTINLSGGVDTIFTIDAAAADFAGRLTINIGNFGVDEDGDASATALLDYTADAAGNLREVFKFVGEDFGNVEITGFLAGVGGNADRLDFSAFAGVTGLDDLNITWDGTDTVITSDAFAGEITVIGVDLSTDAFNFIF